MRELYFDLTQDRPCPLYCFGGYEGEHNATKLHVTLPERMRSEEESQYRFVFETAEQEEIFSLPIPLEEGEVSILLPQQLMISPELNLYVGCYRYREEELVLLAKSQKIVLSIQNPRSVKGETQWSEAAGGVLGIGLDDRVIPESPNVVRGGAIAEELEKCVKWTDVSEDLKKNNHRPVFASAVSEALNGKLDRDELRDTLSESGRHAVTSDCLYVALEKKMDLDRLKTQLQGGIFPEEEASEEKVVSEKAVSHALSQADQRAKNSFAGALKGTKSGTAVLIEDGSEVPCQARVTVTPSPVFSCSYADVSQWNGAFSGKAPQGDLLTEWETCTLLSQKDGVWEYHIMIDHERDLVLRSPQPIPSFSEGAWIRFSAESETIEIFPFETVWKAGRNLFSTKNFERTNASYIRMMTNGVYRKETTDAHLSDTLLKKEDIIDFYNGIPLFPAGTYIFSCDPIRDVSLNLYMPGLDIKLEDGTQDRLEGGVPKAVPQSFIPLSVTTSIMIENRKGNLYSSTFQLEAADKAGEYAPFQEPVVLDATNSEEMKKLVIDHNPATIFTLNGTLTVEYNRDLNGALNEIRNAISLLGGENQ